MAKITKINGDSPKTRWHHHSIKVVPHKALLEPLKVLVQALHKDSATPESLQGSVRTPNKTHSVVHKLLPDSAGLVVASSLNNNQASSVAAQLKVSTQDLE